MLKRAALNKDVKLRPHQQRIVDAEGDGIVIAHAPGSGKTLSSIARFEKQKANGKAKKALVVVPAGLRDNFGVSGVGKFTNSSYQIIGNKQEISSGSAYGNPDPNKDYNIISYEMFRSNPDYYIKATGADTLISDEAHRGKNEDTATLKSIRKSRPKFKNYTGLTGSVISNKISDVYPLIDVASGGNNQLGVKNKDEFESRYLARSNEKAYRGMPPARIPVVGFKHRGQLKSELGKYIDYMDEDDISDVADMPRKKVNVKKVPMTKEQAKLYKGILNDNPKVRQMIVRKRLETLKDDELSKLYSSMIESRKLVNSVGSVTPGMSLRESLKRTPKTSQMLDDLSDHLSKTKDGQAIVMSHLINGGIDIAEQGLKDRKISYGKFIGKGNEGVSEESRQKAVQDFNKRKNRVMLLSSAGGEGVSLNDTTWEGVLDPHYNPEKMKQMEARGTRSGGLSHRPRENREVEVNRYMSTMPRRLFGMLPPKYKSPDEVIYDIANRKEQQNKILQNLMKENHKKMEKISMEKIATSAWKSRVRNMIHAGDLKGASNILGRFRAGAINSEVPDFMSTVGHGSSADMIEGEMRSNWKNLIHTKEPRYKSTQPLTSDGSYPESAHAMHKLLNDGSINLVRSTLGPDDFTRKMMRSKRMRNELMRARKTYDDAGVLAATSRKGDLGRKTKQKLDDSMDELVNAKVNARHMIHINKNTK